MTNDPITAEFAAKVIDLASIIQTIPAPTFNEIRRTEYFLAEFRRLGLADVQHDALGNVLGRLPGINPTNTRPLVVSAHIDTVHPLDIPLGTRRMEDRIIGPGIGDNALGAAALLGLAELFKEKAIWLPGDLWVALNVGEEGLGDLRGIQAVVNQFGSQPLAYLVVEGMGLGTVLHRGLGVERYKISIQTPGGHSWVDYGQPSAIHELCRLVDKLAGLTLPTQPCTTLNVGVIQGGTSVNTIAAHAWLELDLRSEDSATLARLVRSVRETAEGFRKPGVDVIIERIGKRLAGEIPADHPLVKMAVDVLAGMGIEARLDIASTDANLPLSRGYPAICVGVTHGNNAHTTEEFIMTEPVETGLGQLYQLITRAWETLA